MKRSVKLSLYLLLSLAALAAIFFFLRNSDFVVLNPKGLIGLKQRDLMIQATWLMLIVVLPVFVLVIAFAWIYRASNPKAKYTPDWDKSHLAETIWWLFPCIIIVVLSIITWKSSHALDPYKPLDSNVTPLRIQVVALRWKWLFIYPEQNIATVNYIQFPEKVPLNFELTSDAPMNSFWIPQLGGQIYAMPGMLSKLHLIADEPGSYRGYSANISGKGFAGMTFEAKASSEQEFLDWVQSVKNSPNLLTRAEYEQLHAPSEYNPVATYSQVEPGLFDWTIMKYMAPQPSGDTHN